MAALSIMSQVLRAARQRPDRTVYRGERGASLELNAVSSSSWPMAVRPLSSPLCQLTKLLFAIPFPMLLFRLVTPSALFLIWPAGMTSVVIEINCRIRKLLFFFLA
ncbi:hypothetical protein MRX96_002596 [Rhipicephalus microplus]